jgi:hypothetical protein
MNILEAKKIVKELKEYLKTVLVNETNVNALATVLAELDSKNKEIAELKEEINSNISLCYKSFLMGKEKIQEKEFVELMKNILAKGDK